MDIITQWHDVTSYTPGIYSVNIDGHWERFIKVD